MRTIQIVLLLLLYPLFGFAKDYNASLFGIKSDGVSLNTGSIQKAIDFINESGGGRLVFYVGRYLTGSIQLKSNVTLKLEEGAVLVGSSSIYDYPSFGSKNEALICANGQQNIGISGKGVIEGQGVAVLKNIETLTTKGFLKPSELKTQSLIALNNCSDFQMDSVNLWDGVSLALIFDSCKNVSIDRINISNKNVKKSGGIVIKDSKAIEINDSFIDVAISPQIQLAGSNKNIKVQRTIDPLGKLLSPHK